MARTDINIRGRNYSIACSPGQERRVQGLGKLLDTRLDVIASAVGDIGDERLLLIAALALLDELDTARSAPSPSATEQRATHLIADMAARVEALAARLEKGGQP